MLVRLGDSYDRSCRSRARGGETAGLAVGRRGWGGAAFAGGKSGRRHWPAEFCAQTTSGWSNETCRMTRRIAKDDQNWTRNWKLCGLQKIPADLAGLLRNGYAIELQPATRRDANLPELERGV